MHEASEPLIGRRVLEELPLTGLSVGFAMPATAAYPIHSTLERQNYGANVSTQRKLINGNHHHGPPMEQLRGRDNRSHTRVTRDDDATRLHRERQAMLHIVSVGLSETISVQLLQRPPNYRSP